MQANLSNNQTVPMNDESAPPQADLGKDGVHLRSRKEGKTDYKETEQPAEMKELFICSLWHQRLFHYQQSYAKTCDRAADHLADEFESFFDYMDESDTFPGLFCTSLKRPNSPMNSLRYSCQTFGSLNINFPDRR